MKMFSRLLRRRSQPVQELQISPEEQLERSIRYEAFWRHATYSDSPMPYADPATVDAEVIKIKQERGLLK